MSREHPINISASVKQKLLNKARSEKRPFNELIQYFAMERFLYRLSVSEYSDQFILKGALLLKAWGISKFRPTMDIDMLGLKTNNSTRLIKEISNICRQKIEDDGLLFDVKSIKSIPITEGADYVGNRILFLGKLATIKIKMQIDIGYGDSVFPMPEKYVLPQILNFQNTEIICYCPETAIAEKIEAMVKLDLGNSRMKDFYDIWIILNKLGYDEDILAQAITATFKRRQTIFPRDITALTPLFYDDKNKNIQWKAFLRKGSVQYNELSLPEVCLNIKEELSDVFDKVRETQ